jgi:F-type H+-transporting ATPase subunit b
MAVLYDTYLVVAAAFVVFFVVLWRFGVHEMLLRMLDARADKIRRELDEARRLREEAQTMLAQYERKQKEVEETALEIVARAKEDARNAAVAAKKELALTIERRLKAAQDQIASAEAAAIREVKDRAVAVAVAAAAEVIRGSMTPAAQDARIDAAIREVGARLN